MIKLAFKNDDTIPQLGLGTWKSKPGEVYKAIQSAIRLGYRHFDCAFVYGNEAEIGQAFHNAFESGEVKREDLFITSKLWNTHHRKADVEPALKNTLKDLQLDYLDLYLVHWPIAIVKEASFPVKANEFIPVTEIPLTETWEAMIACRDKGLTKHIGVSNFSIANLNQLIRGSSVVPEMNQVECHPYLDQKELLAFCKDHSILMTAYSPFGSLDRSPALKGENEPRLFDDPVLKRVAESHDCTPAQVILAWQLGRGVCVIPKSVNEKRQNENLAAAELQLSGEEMQQIDTLNRDYRFIDGTLWTPEGSPYTLEYLWG